MNKFTVGSWQFAVSNERMTNKQVWSLELGVWTGDS